MRTATVLKFLHEPSIAAFLPQCPSHSRSTSPFKNQPPPLLSYKLKLYRQHYQSTVIHTRCFTKIRRRLQHHAKPANSASGDIILLFAESSLRTAQTLSNISFTATPVFAEFALSGFLSFALLCPRRAMLISGENGCEKTTQVPQFFLDHMWAKGETCKVVCSQPRRIAVISDSQRVSSERGEKYFNSVGYKVRFGSAGGGK